MPTFTKTLHIIALSLISFAAVAQKVNEPKNMPRDWTDNYEPFRIAGNLYYVGTYDLTSYLITTPEGHILINTGTAKSGHMIRQNIKSLGFRVADVKVLLTNHVHFDHVGGMAEIWQNTKAQMMVNEHDAEVLHDGGSSDFALGGKGAMFKALKADRLLHDRDTIKLGGTQVIAMRHPGHTKGATSYLFNVKDKTNTYRVLIANMPSVIDEMHLPSMSEYPTIGKDFAYTFSELKKQEFDLWFAAHGSQFDLHKKHHPGDKYNPEAFRDRHGYDSMINSLEGKYLKRMSAQ